MTILGLLSAVIALAWLRMLVGGGAVSPQAEEAIRHLRFERIQVAMIVGGSLGLAGVLLQSLLRNPLASPDLMGLSAGAGFAVTLRTWQLGVTLGAGAAAGPALGGAALVLLLIWVLSQRRGQIDPITMILIGVIVSVILGAATMLVASMMPDRGFSISRWMMGTLREDLSGQTRLGAAIVLGLVLILSYSLWRSFDAMSLSDDEARSIGVRIGLIRSVQFGASGILTAISIVLAGPIGFVGLVCPHLVRLLAGPSHRALIPSSMLAGMALLLASDTLVRLISTDAGRVPIGVLTALIGGPIFLVLLIRMRR